MRTQQGEPRRFRYSVRTLFVITTVVGVVLAGLVTLGPALRDRYLFGQGTVWFADSWPDELVSLLDSLPDSSRQRIHGIKVYCLKDFIDSEYIWRFNCPENEFTVLCEKNDVRKLTKDDAPASFWHQPPGWWEPEPDAKWVYGSSMQNPFVFIAYDPEKEVLFGWSYFDF